jgi:UDP-N-acetylmuramate dehydrogenase
MKLLEIFGDRVRKNEPLKNHTTYRLGGPADFYFAAESAEEIAAALAAAKTDDLDVFILGGGSNVLVADAGFRGLVISCGQRKIEVQGTRLVADAGAVLFSAVKASVEAGLKGLEWAAGIPGTVGGAVRGNAGAYGGEMKDGIVSVEAADLATGERRSFTNADCAFGYRDSRFKHEGWFILAATFALAPGDKEASTVKLEETLGLRRSKLPLEFGSAGSVFKNYDVSRGVPQNIKDDVPQRFIDYGRIPANWFIERAGLKGRRIGDAMISDKHANFFVNAGSATAADVRSLIAFAKMKVKEAYGVELVEEIEYLGF